MSTEPCAAIWILISICFLISINVNRTMCCHLNINIYLFPYLNECQQNHVYHIKLLFYMHQGKGYWMSSLYPVQLQKQDKWCPQQQSVPLVNIHASMKHKLHLWSIFGWNSPPPLHANRNIHWNPEVPSYFQKIRKMINMSGFT